MFTGFFFFFQIKLHIQYKVIPYSSSMTQKQKRKPINNHFTKRFAVSEKAFKNFFGALNYTIYESWMYVSILTSWSFSRPIYFILRQNAISHKKYSLNMVIYNPLIRVVIDFWVIRINEWLPNENVIHSFLLRTRL